MTTNEKGVSKERLFAYVKETTALAKECGIVERAKAAKTGNSTASTYQRLAKARLDLSSKEGGRLMEGVSARSWHTTRAALLHEAAKAFKAAREACDAAQREADWGTAARHAQNARRAVMAFRSVQDAQKPETTTPKRSARKTLPKAADWLGRAFAAASEVQKPAVAVLWAAGCRPAEIAMGVDVARRPGGVIVLNVPGAKVKADAGQPRRSIAIREDSEAGKALLAVLGDKQTMTVNRPAQRIGKDFADIRAKTGLNITAYSYRHQFAAEMKAKYGPETAGAEQIAAAMGHRVTKSQKHYGSKAQSQGGSGVIAVKAALPVKETRQRPAAAPSKPTKPQLRARLGMSQDSTDPSM